MKKSTNNETKKRLEGNLLFAERVAGKCKRRFTIHDYIPGQVIYNLGEYPASFSIRPTEYDYELLRSLSSHGVGLIQIHEEWNDSMRRLGADKFTSHDPEGLREFISLCHKFGIKVIPYISTGFFDSRDPDFTEEFCPRWRHSLDSSYYRYRMCDPASEKWRSYIINKIEDILDDYDFDGIFNDMGFPVDYSVKNEGYLDYDPYLDEMLCEIYDRVKARSGIVKIHEGTCLCPKTSRKSYDYLWVGEGVRGLDKMKRIAEFEPYLVPCPDFRFMSRADENAFYTSNIALMQFPLRVDGRPITGERATVDGVDYIYNPQNDEKLHFDKVKKWYDEHPDGPHVYSEWSSIPDDTVMRDRWLEYLALYRPTVSEGSVAFVDVEGDGLLLGKKPDGVIMSVAVNDEIYLTVANSSDKTVSLTLADEWVDRQTGKRHRQVEIESGGILFLGGGEK